MIPIRLVAAVALLGAVLAGCASPGDEVRQAAGDADAAVGAAILALEVTPGRTPPGVAATALDDALREVLDADQRVVQSSPSGKRQAVLDALRDAEDALALAKRDPDAGAAALKDARHALEAAS